MRKCECLEVIKGETTILCLFKSNNSNCEWAFTGVYCQGNNEEREKLRKELEANRRKCGDFWIVGWNFNMTLSGEDRNNSNMRMSDAVQFRELVDKLELVDLLLSCGKWTWTNLRVQPVCSRIDRFLVTPAFLAQLPGVIQKTLQRPTSDHCPICLHTDGIQWGPIPFRFDNKWLSNMKFVTLIEEVWKNTVIHGNASFRLVRKLKEVKNVIKVWTKEEKLKEGEAFNSIVQEINEIDLMEGEGVLDEIMSGKRNNLKLDLANLCKAEETSWKQKSRERWVKKGDRNTEYFHIMASNGRRSNYIPEILVGGSKVTGNTEIRKAAKDYFAKLY